jgi:LysR family transcriptional regulator, hydrogen peroxide-inducible genes activator
MPIGFGFDSLALSGGTGSRVTAMEMHQVRYFLAVADELNFTRAAERCHVAQPSLTRAIKLLEEELGGPLFHRERANTHLSELGRMVKPYLDHVFSEAQAAKRQALDFVKLKRTTLKLGVMCTIAPDQLIELVCGLQSRHPGIEIEIVDASARALEERLVAGDLEVTIHCPPANQPDDRLHYVPLYREQFLVVLPAEHVLAERNGIRPADLQGIRYLNRTNCELIGHAGPIWRECGLAFETAYRSERDDWILAMAASGLGFGFMPASCVNHPRVVGRPMIDPEFWREVSLTTVRGRPHSPALGALVREVMRRPWLGKPALAVDAERERQRPQASAGAEGDR